MSLRHIAPMRDIVRAHDVDDQMNAMTGHLVL
jgi:hypothetical protein